MSSNSLRLFVLLLALLAAGLASADQKPSDLTDLFVSAGVTIADLQVLEVDGVLLVRGRTSDPALRAAAMQRATDLGYLRVANLIRIVPALADDAIALYAARELKNAPALTGCTFQVETRKGIVYLLGEVDRRDQKNLAARLVRRIDGVKDVRSGLTIR